VVVSAGLVEIATRGRPDLSEGKARPHRWAPEQGYVTAVVRDEETLDSTMELIRISHSPLQIG